MFAYMSLARVSRLARPVCAAGVASPLRYLQGSVGQNNSCSFVMEGAQGASKNSAKYKKRKFPVQRWRPISTEAVSRKDVPKTVTDCSGNNFGRCTVHVSDSAAVAELVNALDLAEDSATVWINLGPLLYHFADSYGPDDDMSIELSLEDVKRVAYHYGFVMEVEKMIDTTFSANMKSMMQNRYRTTFWTMRKDSSRSKAQKRQ